MPEGGPSQSAATQASAARVGDVAQQAELPFVLVAPSLDLVRALPGDGDRYGALPRGGQREIRARAGDLVLVTIFEAGSGGLFTSPQAPGAAGGGGNFINLPPQAVSVAGTISVPYAGTVRVAGRPLPDVQREIEGRLRERAIEPQVIVTVQEERASNVSVLGSVREARQVPVRNTQMRVLDAIARAGGADPSGRALEVLLQRSGHVSRVSLRRLVSDPSANVPVLAGDVIFVQPNTRAVTVFGATTESSRLDLDIDGMTLTDVIGRARGLNDTRSDAASVFVLRMEDRHILPRNTPQLARFAGARVPTVYQIRYDTPGGIFIGNQFKMRNGDVVYVANASGVQLRKLLEIFNLMTRSVRDVRGTFESN